jgi:hypothetical protein
VAASLLLILVPFRAATRPAVLGRPPNSAVTFGGQQVTAHCDPAVVDAWHASTAARPAPALSVPPGFQFGITTECRVKAQHRVSYAALGLLVAAALLTVAHFARPQGEEPSLAPSPSA